MEPPRDNVYNHSLLEVKLEPKSLEDYGCEFSQCSAFSEQQRFSPPPAEADLLDMKLEDLCANYMDDDNRFVYVEPQPCDDAGYDSCDAFSPESCDLDRDWIDSPSSVESFLSSCSEIVDSYQRNEQQRQQEAIDIDDATRIPSNLSSSIPSQPQQHTEAPLRVRIPHLPETEPITPPPSPLLCSPPQLTLAPTHHHLQYPQNFNQPQFPSMQNDTLLEFHQQDFPGSNSSSQDVRSQQSSADELTAELMSHLPNTPQTPQSPQTPPTPSSPPTPPTEKVPDVLEEAIRQNKLFTEKSQIPMPSLQVYPSILPNNRYESALLCSHDGINCSLLQ